MSATDAQIFPQFLKFDNFNNLFLSCIGRGSNRVYKIDSSNIIHLVAGNGADVDSGDGGLATNAAIRTPGGIAFDKCNNLYIGDSSMAKIRKVTFDTSCHLGTINVGEIENNIEISIYPNPATEVVNIDNIKSPTKYRVFNITGNIEQQGTLKEGSNSIFIKTLPSGMHLLELTNYEGVRMVRKIVVN